MKRDKFKGNIEFTRIDREGCFIDKDKVWSLRVHRNRNLTLKKMRDCCKKLKSRRKKKESKGLKSVRNKRRKETVK